MISASSELALPASEVVVVEEEEKEQQQQQQWQPSPQLVDGLLLSKRCMCSRCRRPQRVCLCPALPDAPLQLAGRVVVLQHPHETKKKLATVPLLSLVLTPCSLMLLKGRRLRPKLFPALDVLLDSARAAGAPVLVLWPGPGVQSITDICIPRLCGTPEDDVHVQQQQHACTNQPAQQQQQQEQVPGDRLQQSVADAPAYVLVVVDGTWQHAKEMFDVLQPWLLGPGGPAVQVQLPLTQQHKPTTATTPSTTGSDSTAVQQAHQQLQQAEDQDLRQPSSLGAALPLATSTVTVTDAPAALAKLVLQPDPHCRLRTEPHEGCTTTYEAVVQALSHLEQQVNQQQQQREQCSPCTMQQQQQSQSALLAALIRPLQLMTALQARFSPAVRARTQEGGTAVVGTKARLGMSTRRLPAAPLAPS